MDGPHNTDVIYVKPEGVGLPLKSTLVIEDEHLLLWALVKRFRRAGFEAEGRESAEAGLLLLESRPFGLVVLDLRLPGMDGMECLRTIKERWPDTIVVMMTAHGDIGSAVQAMRLGAYNYLTKPFEFSEVLAIAESVLGVAERTADEGSPLATTASATGARPDAPTSSGGSHHRYGIESLLGDSPAMQQVKALCMKVASSATTTVLLTGESGTGKDHFAKVLHYSSSRAQKPFIQVNVTSLAPTLFESELFGHEKGSFTGAAARKKGLLEISESGSMYLDEIGELDVALQADLLHVLENRTFKRVGGLQDLELDVRFIAATNSDLRSKVADGAFRQDLYYRLRVVPIELPPLRDRADDVLVLAHEFARRCSESFGGTQWTLSPGALDKLRTHTWPGNVRELRNVIERACVLGDGAEISAETIAFEEPITPLAQARQGYLSESRMNLEDSEKRLIESALERAEWNQVRAAELLGLGRDALRYRMKKHNLL